MKVVIRRFREGKLQEENFQVKVERGTTILDLLYRIREQDPGLSFRAMCRAGICGTCAVKVNGEPKLACTTPADGHGELLIEPLDNSVYLKDLVVEHKDIFARLKRARVRLEAYKETFVKPSDMQKLWKSKDCILCGICNSVCPSLQTDREFGAPSTFTKAFGVVEDPRNANSEDSLKALLPLDIQGCVHCKNCDIFCPKGCSPEILIKLLEGKMLKKGYIQKREEDFGFLGF